MTPQSEAERSGAVAAGLDLTRIYDVADLVNSDRVLFASAPIT